MFSAPSITSRPLLLLLVFTTSWMGLPLPEAQAAPVSSVVFNNVSGSPALNVDPSSWDDHDDVRVKGGGDLYLPSSSTAVELGGWVVFDDGTRKPFDAGDYALAPGRTGGEWILTFDGSGAGTTIAVHQSAKVPSMFITTGSGLAAIESSKDFEDTGASMALVDEGSSALYQQGLSEMKGRGNSTWAFPKKPYQIKLANSSELVPGAGAHKTWILLANYLDQSVVRNQLAYDLEGSVLVRAGAVDHSIKGRMVDLFIDGGFRGSYYLTEKVQVGPTRLAISDLQKANETANPGLGSLDPVRTTSLNGAPGLREAGYVPFPTTPAGYESSGYLLEMDFASGSRAERSYVVTRNGTPFSLKGPEDANAAEVAFVGNRLQQLEDAIYSPTGRNAGGVHFSELLDVGSWARYYLVQEMIANDDAFKSSTYFHMDGGGKLRAGPLWDADRTLGALRTAPDPVRMHVADPARLKPRWIHQLLAHQIFRTAVQQAYTTVVGPEVDEVLAESGHLSRYADEVSRSASLNRRRWIASIHSVAYRTPAENIAHLRSYLQGRQKALAAVWQGSYTTGTMPRDGYYTLGNRGLNFDVTSASLTPGASITLWTPNATGAQTYRLQRGKDSYYSITNVNSTLALAVNGGVAASTTPVVQERVNGTDVQRWRLSTLDGSRYTIASAAGTAPILDTGGPESGYVMDVPSASGTVGTPLALDRSTASAGQEFGLTPVQLPAAPADGRTYTLGSALGTTKVLDVANGSALNRANIRLWRANGTAAQRFTINTVANGAMELWTGTGSSGVVDVAGGGKVSGTNVWQYAWNGSTAQQWVARPTGDLSGSFYVVSRHNGLHLHVQDGVPTDGANIQVFSRTGSRGQKFMFMPAS